MGTPVPRAKDEEKKPTKTTDNGKETQDADSLSRNNTVQSVLPPRIFARKKKKHDKQECEMCWADPDL